MNLRATASPLVGPDYPVDAHRTYRRLREAGPMCRIALPGGLRVWAVTRYQEVLASLAEPLLTRDPRLLPEIDCDYLHTRYPEDCFNAVGRHLLNTDGADHRRLRRHIQPFFTRHRCETLRPLIENVARSTVDRVAAGPRADLVADFAVPIPLTVISVILGIPPEYRSEFAERLSIVSAPIHPDTPAARKAIDELSTMALSLMAEKRDSTGDDLITALVRAHYRDRSVSRLEITSSIIFLLGAGYETTTSLLSNAALTLLTDPALLARLRVQPRLMDAVVEELLRHDAPLPFGMARFATDFVHIAETTIGPGEIMLPLLAAANRDPLVYDEPDLVRPGRTGPAQLSFGVGLRRCVGAELAKLEAGIALRALIDRLPRMRLAVDPASLRRHGVLHIRGLDRLPVIVNPA
jgi:cytochrome P450